MSSHQISQTTTLADAEFLLPNDLDEPLTGHGMSV